MKKNILIVLLVIVGIILITAVVNDQPSPKPCAAGLTLVEYENGDMQKPICKGIPAQEV